MNSLKITLIASFFMLSLSSSAQKLLNKEEIGTTFTHFYIHPDTGTLRLLIRTIQEDQEAREALPSAPVVGFFSAILLSSSPNRKIVEHDLKAIRNRYDLFDYALYFGKTKDTIYQWTSRKPDTNDLYWGAFYGTGDTRYLDKLIYETRFMTREDSLSTYMAGASAKWSLATNARQHQTVKNHLLSKEVSTDEQTKKMIGEILRQEPELIREEILKKSAEIKGRTRE